jgi:8-oxo-dGTP pyrophosphatase MutT (NUDIX family)
VTVARKRVAGIILLREPDGAALLQHRDDKPGLPHANLWVPPGGHCEAGEAFLPCARREFHEETGYRCANLRLLRELHVDDVEYSPPLLLSVFWDVYDGRQAIVCGEGQALEFKARSQAPQLAMPAYLVELWDQAIDAWRRSRVAQ